jgi:hypothetical protein
MSGGEASFTVRQDPDHLARRKITAVTVGSVVVMFVALVIAWTLLSHWSTAPLETTRAAPRTIGTLEQSLIIDVKRGLDLRDEQEKSLHRWSWVDRDAGVARIPIERAMELVVDRPIPADRPLSPLAPTSTTGAPERPPAGLEVTP